MKPVAVLGVKVMTPDLSRGRKFKKKATAAVQERAAEAKKTFRQLKNMERRLARRERIGTGSFAGGNVSKHIT